MNKYFNSCRICLRENGTILIFENSNNLRDNICLCFGEKLEDCYVYPRKICITCHHKLNEAVDFIRIYQKSCKTLQEELDMIVKKEEPELETENDNFHDDNFINNIKPENNILDNTELDNNIKNTQNYSKIVYGNAQQLDELIKPLINEVKKAPMTINKPKKNKKSKNEKQDKEKIKNKKRKPKTGSNKIKKSRKRIVKKIINTRYTDKIVSTALLEGKFVFDNDQWCLEKKHTEETSSSNPKLRVKTTLEKKTEKTSDVNTKLCDVCGKVFPHEKMKYHKMKHVQSNTSTCTVCSKTLCDAYALRRHMRTVHATEKPNICPTCGKCYSVPALLKAHIQTVHMNMKREVKRKPCEYCGRLLANKKSLILHVRSAHTGERPVACTVCDARFYHEEYLITHMRLHTGETPYKCPLCGRGYAQLCNMKSHIKHNHSISQLDEETKKNIHPRYLKIMKP